MMENVMTLSILWMGILLVAGILLLRISRKTPSGDQDRLDPHF